MSFFNTVSRNDTKLQRLRSAYPASVNVKENETLTRIGKFLVSQLRWSIV